MKERECQVLGSTLTANPNVCKLLPTANGFCCRFSCVGAAGPLGAVRYGFELLQKQWMFAGISMDAMDAMDRRAISPI
jgi:hypothetical protein